MAKTLNGERVSHRRTGRMGTCKGPSKTHRDWYNILWDGETQCYRYTKDEFKVHEDAKSNEVT